MEVDEKTRAALAVDLLEKVDLAITTLPDMNTVQDVHWFLQGMIAKGKEMMK